MRAAIIAIIIAPVMGSNVASAQNAQTPEGWELSVGGGLVFGPKYLGDDEYRLQTAPNVRIRYRNLFFASIQGVGLNLVRQNGFRAGPIMRFDFGRREDDESIFALFGGGTSDLEGLGDVDPTVEVGGFVEYGQGPIAAKAQLRHGLGGHEALIGEASLQLRTRFAIAGQPLMFGAGPHVRVADGDYTDAYFSVDAAQSATSGLSPFDASGAFVSYGIGANVAAPLTSRFSVGLSTSYDRLAGDAADSSLVQERGSEHQFRGGLFLTYRIGS